MDLGKIKTLFSEIQEEWDKAEETIKQAEQVCNNIIIPSIKELRYAGRRLVDALNAAASGKSEREVLSLLADAKFDCH